MIYRPQSQLARLRSERYGDNAKAKVPMSFSYHGPRRAPLAASIAIRDQYASGRVPNV